MAEADEQPVDRAHHLAEDGKHVEAAEERGALAPQLAAPGITLVDAEAIRQSDPSSLGTQVVRRFESDPGRFWLHVDLDVLDQEVLPAVDYPMPNGLTRSQLANLVRPLAQSTALIGADITIYNPNLDPDGRYADEIVTWMVELVHEVDPW
ncbi:MAG: arginase family protein [Acidobacteriota bacterium]